MYSFRNDYSELAHPQVLGALARYAAEQNAGYGLDRHSERAADLIRSLADCPDAAVHFISGGTQANMLLISSLLRPYEAVIAAATGHINVHETGAVEASGHKVLTAPGVDGKLSPEDIREIVSLHTDEHMVMPRMVYLSDSTELGTIYRKAELAAIRETCQELGLYLYLDGARLGSALTSAENDLTLPDITDLTDAFYIGGTKNGALFGEALVLVAPALRQDFRYAIKNRGAMLAKGFAAGIQFEALFEDNLYFRLAEHANELAARLTEALLSKGYQLYAPSPTNQVFPILTDGQCKALAADYEFEIQKTLPDGRIVIRLVTSFATPRAAVEELIGRL